MTTLAERIAALPAGTAGTPAQAPTPATGPQTLTVYSKQINLDGNGVVVAGDARTVAEKAVLGPQQASEFASGQIKSEIFSNNARAFVPHVTNRASSYSPSQKNTRVDRIRITATDGTTTTSHDFYIGHASDKTAAQIDADLAAGIDDVYTVKHLVQGINRDLGGFLRAEVTTNGRIRFEAAGDFKMELIEKSPGPGSSTKPWDSLINLFGVVDAGGDGDMTTGVSTFEFASGTGSAANYDASANADGNYAISFNPGTRPTGGFAAATPGTPGASATGLLAEWDALVTQLGQVIADAGVDGTNLLTGEGRDIRLSERSHAARLSLEGLRTTMAGLGISGSDAGFTTPSDIAERMAELKGASKQLASRSHIAASALAIVESRETFSNDMIATLDGGADDLMLADIAEESAKLAAAQTRMDLAATALGVSAGTKPFLLRYLEAGGGFPAVKEARL